MINLGPVGQGLKSIKLLLFFCLNKARIFSLVDLWDFFSDKGSKGGGGGGWGGGSSENDQLTCHFQSFFFLISPAKIVKLVR